VSVVRWFGRPTGSPRVSDRATVNEQHVRDRTTRRQLREFFRSSPADRFRALAVGAHVLSGDRDQQFTVGFDTILAGLEAASANRAHASGGR
jgi:hypothetical protein